MSYLFSCAHHPHITLTELPAPPLGALDKTHLAPPALAPQWEPWDLPLHVSLSASPSPAHAHAPFPIQPVPSSMCTYSSHTALHTPRPPFPAPLRLRPPPTLTHSTQRALTQPHSPATATVVALSSLMYPSCLGAAMSPQPHLFIPGDEHFFPLYRPEKAFLGSLWGLAWG